MKTCVLSLIDGVHIIVPDSLSLITPYVLIEQNDWFEDEIKFLRKLLKSSQKVIDIGANYGVYTLSMAKAIGSTGRLWAFEPASATAALLRESVKSNNFLHVQVEQCALSIKSGTAQLSLCEQPEMNSLSHFGSECARSETVVLTTLDECIEKFAWDNIDFVKLDAEGEESNILNGGEKFLSKISPLIQYEIKVNDVANLRLVDEFERLGYQSYRLVPGLDVLVPFSTATAPDDYLLNLFCCKKDRAKILADHGYLIQKKDIEEKWGKSIFNENPSDAYKYSWQHTLSKLPYAAPFIASWSEYNSKNKAIEALAYYALSQDHEFGVIERFLALEQSLSLMKTQCIGTSPSLQFCTLARIASEFGERAVSVDALNQLANHILDGYKISINEPFLMPIARFEFLCATPGKEVNWIMASVLEGLEKLGAYSSFYTGEEARDRLELIQELGWGSNEMHRRLALLKTRFG